MTISSIFVVQLGKNRLRGEICLKQDNISFFEPFSLKSYKIQVLDNTLDQILATKIK